MKENGKYQYQLELATRNHQGDLRKICVGDPDGHEILVWTDRDAALTVNVFTNKLRQYLGGTHIDTEWRKTGYAETVLSKDGIEVTVETVEFGRDGERDKDWASTATVVINILTQGEEKNSKQ